MTIPVSDFAPAERGRDVLSADSTHLAEARGHTARGVTDGPVIVMSYAFAGASHVQDVLADGTDLACTSGTGIIPLCAAAAETWHRVEGTNGPALSSLAASAIRALVTAQVTSILAVAGKTRWCELATAQPGAAEPFFQVFPHTRFVCVHRRCLDVVRAALQASPWGLQGQALTPYLLAYPGNSVGALAAYWADSAEQLLAFEERNRERTQHVCYEDVTAHPDQALTMVRAWLRLSGAGRNSTVPDTPRYLEPNTASPGAGAKVPAEMIPDSLRQRISRLHAELGYPSPSSNEGDNTKQHGAPVSPYLGSRLTR